MHTVMFTKGKEKEGRGQGGEGVKKCERACPLQKCKGLSDVIVLYLMREVYPGVALRLIMYILSYEVIMFHKLVYKCEYTQTYAYNPSNQA